MLQIIPGTGAELAYRVVKQRQGLAEMSPKAYEVGGAEVQGAAGAASRLPACLPASTRPQLPVGVLGCAVPASYCQPAVEVILAPSLPFAAA